VDKFESLQLFTRIVELGSFSKAALIMVSAHLAFSSAGLIQGGTSLLFNGAHKNPSLWSLKYILWIYPNQNITFKSAAILAKL